MTQTNNAFHEGAKPFAIKIEPYPSPSMGAREKGLPFLRNSPWRWLKALVKDEVKVGIALSGGMAYSMAHIGVLKALERAEIPIHCIAGTSGGALIGCLYASGMSLEEMEELAQKARWRLFSGFNFPTRGLLSSENIEKFIHDLLGKASFEDLKLPFCVVGADLQTGEEVLIMEGPVARAVRASCSIPQVFTPVEIGSRLIVDGGIVNKIPVSAVAQMGADVIIGSDVGFKSRDMTALPTNIFQVIIRIMAFIAEDRARREREMADVMVFPPIVNSSPLDLKKSKYYIAQGMTSAIEMMPVIKQKMKKKAWRLHKLFSYLKKKIKSFTETL